MSDLAFPGEQLRRRREELRYSPDDIYRDIHIPADSLEAFESGRLDTLPAPAYAVGFLRSYCIHLGLNPNPYVEAYRACTQPSVRRSRTGEVFADPPGWWTEMRTWASVCGVLLLLWITYMVVVPSGLTTRSDGVEAGTRELVAPAAPVLDPPVSPRP